MYRKYGKRFFDILLSSIAIIFLQPLFLILILLIRIKLGKPTIFRQQRTGKNGRSFILYKFRTMTDQRNLEGELLPDKKRITKFGEKLRRSSLDELPELINILKGDMSIVGPRPLLVEYLDRYNEEQRHRHDVRPGLTGLAQINGRNSITWEEKFILDLRYINNITFLIDLKIIIKTIKKFILKEGINGEGVATVEAFLGSDKKEQ